MKRVGFVGLGAIGRPMARRLLDAGFEVAVFDVVTENTRELVRLGAVEVRSPEEAARGAEAVVVMVATPEQALRAILGDRGVSSGLRRGSPLILTSTVGPKAARELQKRLGGMGEPLMDAQVSGGFERVRKGELLNRGG